MSTEKVKQKVKQYAVAAQRNGHEIDKLNDIAKAIFELADALELIEKKIERKG